MATGLNYVAAYNMGMIQSDDVRDAMMAGIRKTKPKFAKL
jgi:delta(3,5)-delta(2,4)-dienoyl-CoA isomerase